MRKEEFKEISDYLDKRLILCNAVKEPINKDLDYAIKLSVAYEILQQRIDKAIKYIENNISLDTDMGTIIDVSDVLSILKGKDK